VGVAIEPLGRPDGEPVLVPAAVVGTLVAWPGSPFEVVLWPFEGDVAEAFGSPLVVGAAAELLVVEAEEEAEEETVLVPPPFFLPTVPPTAPPTTAPMMARAMRAMRSLPAGRRQNVRGPPPEVMAFSE
jgi:hypothetical protein